ncbi:MAG TPA: hypothetical protein VJC16_07390 [Candidatus Nanoarchaeia archaeon]|nr:hypothetical protein [Candidatus Nanoarchaeia archaeon]
MDTVFEIGDKTGRKIRLTRTQWKHISHEHPTVTNIEEIKETLQKPIRIKPSAYDPLSVAGYYWFNKDRKRYLCVSVKYLNGEGFVITAFYMRNIR